MYMYSDGIATITIHLFKVFILAQQMVKMKSGDISLSHGWWDRFRLRHPQVTRKEARESVQSQDDSHRPCSPQQLLRHVERDSTGQP